jgi:hypothetical protein
MHPRTVLIILLVLILLVAFGPALVAVGSQEIAVFWAGSPSAGARRRKLSFASC